MVLLQDPVLPLFPFGNLKVWQALEVGWQATLRPGAQRSQPNRQPGRTKGDYIL